MSNHSKPWNKGMLKPDCAPTKKPTVKDICWAAGVYEGEGTCRLTSDRRPNRRVIQHNIAVNVSQKDDWLCPQLRDLFGGKVRKYNQVVNDKVYEYNRWDVYGPRALGFLETIFVLLSPRRQGQIKVILDAVRIGESAHQRDI